MKKTYRNPLGKRLPRELVSDLGKYLVIFLFMTATIAFVSGFLVADGSMLAAYQEGFEKYCIEDGNFTVSGEITEKQKARIEKEDVTVYENFYVEEDADNDADGTADAVLRIYKERTEVDLICLMKGEMPESADEIAIDRMYADNNGLSVGDTFTVGKKTLRVCGLVAFSDYSCLFSDNSDMMFDAVKFGVAVMTEEGFNQFGTVHLTYRYSWLYDNPPADEEEEKEISDDFIEVLASHVSLTDCIPRYANQAIQFTGDDMGSDKSMMVVLLYILIVIIAFVFAVTTNGTITKEAAVIGTLRASGYTRGELLRHYLALPIFVTLLSAFAGNVLGYTVMKNVCAGMYYGSYSLPTYVTRWNGEAFVMTTLFPVLLMAVINTVVIAGKLRYPTLAFLRRDLSRKKNRRAVSLPNFKFFMRFRIRILFQNKSGYLILLFGVIFANVLLLFGMMMSPLLKEYQEQTIKNMLAKYQYILNIEETDEEDQPDEYTLMDLITRMAAPSYDTENEDAEKFCMSSLKIWEDGEEGESVSVYGVEPDSRYAGALVSDELTGDGVYISDGYAEKFGIEAGDTVTLKEAYESDVYTFSVKGIRDYPGAIAVFMNIGQYREAFGKEEDYFNAYFSDTEITDIDEDYIAATITEDDLTKVSRQLNVSMGQMFYLIDVFAVFLFILLIYILTKLVIERNTVSISMVKILGYENREIVSLYLVATTWVAALSILISLPVATELIRSIYGYMMMEFSGWLTLYIAPDIYPKMFFLGMGVYLPVLVLQYRKIRRIPMDEALKNVE